MEAAIDHLDLSYRSFLNLNKDHLAVSTQVSKLIALAMLGRYDEAIECGLRCRVVFEREGDYLSLGKIEHNIGNIYFRRDRYKEAEEFQRSARGHFERAGDKIQLAKIENSLALTLSQQHLTKAAEQLYEQALRRAEEVDLKSTQAEIESSIGTLALYQGLYDRALDYLERSRRKYEELDLPHILALTEQEIADAYLELNLSPEAIDIYKRVVDRFAKLRMHADEARALAYQGRAEIGLGHLEQAQQLLSRARELYEREGNQVGAALVELTEAQLFYAKKDYLSTQVAASHVESILSSAGNSRRVVFARWLQGEAARADGRIEEGVEILNASLELAEQLDQPDSVSRCRTSLGLCAAAVADTTEAEHQFRLAVEVIEKLRAPLPGEEFRTAFFSDKLAPYIELTRLMLQSKPPRLRDAFLFIEKARSRSLADAVVGSLSIGLHPRDQFDSTLLERLDQKRCELSYFYNQINQVNFAKSSEEIGKLQLEIQRRETAISELTRQLTHGRSERGSTGYDFDLGVLQTQLGDEKVIVEFGSVDDELLAFVITDSEIRVVRDLASVTEITADVANFRFQIDSLRFGSAAIRKHLDTLSARAKQRLGKIYSDLIAPISDLLGNRDLIVVPTGNLHYLPFHALHDGERYLIESRAISYAPSATVLQHCLTRKQPRVEKAILIGVADERTPQIIDEIEQLSSIFRDSRVFLNEAATHEGLKSESTDADLVHLACHANFRGDNPQFSAIQLGDGWLTVSEASKLSLRSALVTLSACETGVNAIAPGEELIGLARGFLSAGSASVLLSLWTVDDESTRSLMTNFYRELAVHNQPSKALRSAQLEVLREREHPFFWSPFVLVGRW